MEQHYTGTCVLWLIVCFVISLISLAAICNYALRVERLKIFGSLNESEVDLCYEWKLEN